MATATNTQLLTAEEFHARYDGLKPYYEFWDGKAVQKSAPTLLHMLTQGLIKDMLKEAGYQAGTELELRIVRDWHPIPDVVATVRVQQQPYPTEPLDVVVEVLSPDDRMDQVEQKCERYAAIGIKQVIVLDPEHRFGMTWSADLMQLLLVKRIGLPSGTVLELSELWHRLSSELS